jgi:Ca2+-binding RTX toxin-like protein
MARFNLNGFLDNSRFEDFFARFGGGSADHDHLNGTTGSNTLFGGASEDTLAGMAGNDTLNGGSGADKLWGARVTTTSRAAPATTFWLVASALT